LYLLANVAYIATLTWDGIQHAASDRVGTAAMEQLFGGAGTWIMAAAIVVSTFGCNNGLILAGARVFFAMAGDGLFFKPLRRLNRFHVPGFALAAQGLWACVLTLPRTVNVHATTGETSFGNVYTQLLEYIVGAELVFYLLLVSSLLVLRFRRPNADRPYRTWGYPATPILYLALASVVLVDLVAIAPETSGIGFLIVLTGIPVYFLWRK
jgi:APA family basic amino acid/polyamine antiporter